MNGKKQLTILRNPGKIIVTVGKSTGRVDIGVLARSKVFQGGKFITRGRVILFGICSPLFFLALDGAE